MPPARSWPIAPKQASLALKDVTLAAPHRPATILCSGSNYKDHNAEKANTPISGKEPEFFVKTADCVVGPDEPIAFDERFSKKIDCEVELAIVIGKAGRFIPAERALEHVFGYTIVNDVTARDRQVRRTPEGMTWYELGSRQGVRFRRAARTLHRHRRRDRRSAEAQGDVAHQRRTAPVEQHLEHDLDLRRADPLLLAQLHAQARHGHHHRHAGRHRVVGRQGTGRQGHASAGPRRRRRATACRATWSNARSRASASCAIRSRRRARPRTASPPNNEKIQWENVHGSPQILARARCAAPMAGRVWLHPRRRKPGPTRNITMIVPFPPGGQADLAARPVALALEKILGKSVVVDNRSRRGRHARQRRGGARRARRPYAPDGAVVDDVPAGGRAALRPQAVLRIRSARADRPRAGRSGRALRAQRLALQDGRRSRRRRQEAARPDFVQLVGQLRRRPCAVRDVPAGRRHQAAARAVSRRRAGADRVHRQAGRHHRAGAGADHAACAERRRPAAGELGRQARRRVSRRADHDRARLQGRRILHLGRPVRAEGHAGAGRSRACATPCAR